MDIEKFKNDLIRQINKYRKDHGASALKKDPKIDKLSQKFAEDLAKKGKLDYSYNQYKGEDLGESVYKSESYIAPLKLAKFLYDEILDYDFKSKNPEPSNFTQMVWKNSESFGFGAKQSAKGVYFFVLNYYPSGNVDGEFKDNVSPIGGSNNNSISNKTTKESTTSKASNKKKEYDDDPFEDFENDNDFKKFQKDNCKKKVTKVVNNNDNGYEVHYEYEYSTSFSPEKEKKDNKKEKNKKNEKKYEYYEEYEEYEEIKPEKNVKIVYEDKSKSSSPSKKDKNKKFDLKIFRQEALEAHNKIRNIHHVGPLKINEEINKIAQEYAEELAKINRLEHSDNCYQDEPLGENLYFCGGLDPSGETITKSWYNESKIHKYDGDWMNGTGHFTQLIWKDSKEVGFGITRNAKGSIYCVANYFPSGNVMGFFKKNVFRP